MRGKEEGGSGLSPLIKIDQSPSRGLLGLAFLRPEAAFHNVADMILDKNKVLRNQS